MDEIRAFCFPNGNRDGPGEYAGLAPLEPARSSSLLRSFKDRPRPDPNGVAAGISAFRAEPVVCLLANPTPAPRIFCGVT